MGQRILYTLILIVLIASKIYAQNFNMEYLTVDNGLTNNFPQDFYQDSTGFMWIATESGLNRYDGFDVKQFFSDPYDSTSITHNTVFSICPINGSSFFIATYHGISKYIPEQENFATIKFNIEGKTLTPTVPSIIKTKEGNFLAATNEGIFKYSNEEGIFKPFNFNIPNSPIKRRYVVILFEDKDQNIWIGTYDQGIFLYNQKQKTISEITFIQNNQNLLEKNKISKIKQDLKGDIWIATEKGVYKYNNNHVLKRYSTQNNLADNTVFSIYQRKNGELLFTGPNGLSQYNYATDQFIQDKTGIYASIKSNTINAITEDKQGNLWMGTQQLGIVIFRFQKSIFSSIQSRNLSGTPAINDFILSVTEDHAGKIWIGTNGAGINIVDPKTNFAYNINSKVSNTIAENYIQTILEDRKQNIWIGSYLGGLTKYNPNTKEFKNYKNIPDDKSSMINDIVNFVFEDSKGTIWILTHDGLSRYVEDSDDFVNYKTRQDQPIVTNFATCMIEDHENLWIGTYNGLFCYNQQTEELKPYLANKNLGDISDNVIYSLFKDKAERIWIGTFNGLNLFNPASNKFTTYTRQQGLGDNLIEGILEDDNGYLWLSTSIGLSRFDTQKGLFLNFGKKDGLEHNTFQHGAFAKTTDNKLLFGSKNGLIVVNPTELNESNSHPQIVITEFKIFDKTILPRPGTILEAPIDKTEKIILKNNQSFFSFSFSSLNYTTPMHDNFLCYMEGYDYDWRNLGNTNTITYTRIPPGKYTFNIKVINKNSTYETSKKIEIIIKPPFWKTKWMYSLYLVLILLATFLVYRDLYARAKYKQNLLIARLEKEKLSEINQSKIKFFINVSHEFKTPLTLILSPLEMLLQELEHSGNKERQKHLLMLVYNNAQRLSRLINQIMDIRKIENRNIQLKARHTDIVAISENIFNFFIEQANNHHIDYRFIYDTEPIRAWIDEEMFEKIIFNLLSNAFKHTPDFESIIFSIQKHDNQEIRLSIKDTGHGIPKDDLDKIFERFYQVENDKTGNPSSSGIGLSIVMEYTKLHGGSVSVESELEKGAEFVVIIPLGNAHLTNEQKDETTSEHPIYKSAYSSIIPPVKDQTSKDQSEKSQKDKPRLLLVEDNYELRNYLLSTLGTDFNVYEAADGEEGLKMTNQLLPNMVISDVMMPKMSGFELCHLIKSDIKTSHIPVLLLTVLDSEKDKIDGYEGGADGYLEKPFDINVLKSRINNLLSSRAKLRQKYLNELNPDIATVSTNRVDQNFLEKAQKVMAKNLSNIEFSTEDFAYEMNMSRSNLHLKLKALTDQSATEFIRSQRLKEAAKQLSTFQYNISEVAYLVGFNNISYFNRCFKKQFDVTPSQFIDELKQ